MFTTQYANDSNSQLVTDSLKCWVANRRCYLTAEKAFSTK